MSECETVSDQRYQPSGVYTAAEPSTDQVTYPTSDLLDVSVTADLLCLVEI